MLAIFIVWFLIIFVVALTQIIGAMVKVSKGNNRIRKTISSDGHVVPKDQDLTCERYGHDHRKEGTNEFGRRYIVHEDPEEGFVVLNGVKRKISDCKNL